MSSQSYLLDTHIWLWSLLEPKRIKASVRAVLESERAALWISSISLWEAHLLIERGRIEVSGQPAAWIRSALREGPLREQSVTGDIALGARAVVLPHADPADRFIAATAKVYGLTLVTADHNLWKCKEIDLLKA